MTPNGADPQPKPGFDPAYFDHLAEIEDAHFWFVGRNALIVGLLDKFFPNAKTAIEFGCGNGAVLQAISKARAWERLVGSDIYGECEATFRRRLPQAEFVQLRSESDIGTLGRFDFIGAFDVLEHIDDDKAAIRSIGAALHPGGGCIIAVPQHPWLWSTEDEIGFHRRRYARGEMERKLSSNGFEILFSTSYMTLLLPLMVASRIASRFSSRKASLKREWTPSPAVNALLLSITRREIAGTLADVRWPVGGSRIVVARRV